MTIQPTDATNKIPVCPASSQFSNCKISGLDLGSSIQRGPESNTKTFSEKVVDFFTSAWDLIVWIFTGCPSTESEVKRLKNSKKPEEKAAGHILKTLQNPNDDALWNIPLKLAGLKLTNAENSSAQISVQSELLGGLAKKYASLLKTSFLHVCKDVQLALEKGSKKNDTTVQNLLSFFKDFLPQILAKSNDDSGLKILGCFADGRDLSTNLKPLLLEQMNKIDEFDKEKFTPILNEVFKNEANSIICISHQDLSKSLLGLEKPLNLYALFGGEVLKTAETKAFKDVSKILEKISPIVGILCRSIANLSIKERTSIAERLSISLPLLQQAYSTYSKNMATQ